MRDDYAAGSEAAAALDLEQEAVFVHSRCSINVEWKTKINYAKWPKKISPNSLVQ